jgi:hypothetical protein
MRLIDADAIPYKKIMFDEDEDDFYYGVTQPYIDRMPTIDAVPVVRCKDCKYCHIEDEYEAWCHGGLPAVLTRATEDFCSHGQRREDGDA